jgi:hypothetical protein
VRPIGRLGRVAGLLGRLGCARRGGGEQACRADGWVSAHSVGIKRKSFLFSKSFYHLQTNLNLIQIWISMTSTCKIKYKNISPTKENYASAWNATIKYLFKYVYYGILFFLEK